MNLANEAGYLYVLSKKLVILNKELKKLSGQAVQHITNHYKAEEEKKKEKHKVKHENVAQQIEKLHREHKKIVRELQRHMLAFEHALHKEHKI